MSQGHEDVVGQQSHRTKRGRTTSLGSVAGDFAVMRPVALLCVLFGGLGRMVLDGRVFTRT